MRKRIVTAGNHPDRRNPSAQIEALNGMPVYRILLLGTMLAALAAINTHAQPGVLAQPQDQFLDAGNTATFTFAVADTGTVTYQWFFNSEQLANSTNRTLRLINPQPSPMGNVFAVASNASGSVPL